MTSVELCWSSWCCSSGDRSTLQLHTHCISHRELSAHKPRRRTADTAAKLEQTLQYPPPPSQWTGTERQPPPWTDELAEMSRHIYTRHGIGDGVQKPIFQVRTREKVICDGNLHQTHIVLFVFRIQRI